MSTLPEDKPRKKKKKVAATEPTPKKKVVKVTDEPKPKKKRVRAKDEPAPEVLDAPVPKKKKKVVDPVTGKERPKAKVKAKEKRALKAHTQELATQEPRKRITRLSNDMRARTLFGDSAELIHQLLEDRDTDNARDILIKTMLQSLVDMIPYAENNIRKTKGQKGVYQLNGLITSVRELLIDVQSQQDRGRIGELMVERVIAPFVLDIGMAVVKRFEFLSQDAKARMEPKDFREYQSDLVKHRGEIADYIQRQFMSMSTELKNFLQR